MDLNVKVVQAGGNTLIGTLLEDKILIKPRVIIISNAGPNRARCDFATIIGNPKEIRLHHIDFSYEPDDEEMKKAYLQAVTGLTLATGAVSNLNS